jgi:nucleoside 2-deoxyribosyltransferase
MKIYLAGAISGLTYSESEDWRDTAKQLLADYCLDGYSPLRKKDYLKGGAGVLSADDKIEGSYTVHPLSTSKGIVTRDYFDVSTSDAVLVNLLGAERVSIGTVMEIAFAWYHRIPLVLICEEDNIHWKHPFINEMVSYRVDTLQDGVDIVASILLP